VTKHPYWERPLRRRRVHKGKAVDFWSDTVRLSTGVTAVREYLGHPGAVAAVPVLEGGADPKILMVAQYRYPVGEMTLEIPAGKLDKGENPLACVRRELSEETGYGAKKITKLLSFWPTAAFANEIIHIYIARSLTKGRPNPDADEMIHAAAFRLSELFRRIRRGRIKDSKTIIALLAFAKFR